MPVLFSKIKKNKIHLVFLIIAFFSGILLTNYLHTIITPYIASTVLTGKVLYESVFHDFDKDGNSEQVTFNFNELMQKYILTVFNDQRKIIAYDRFDNYSSLLNSLVTYHEFNGDGYDDVFIFTRDNEKLYLSLFDVNNEKFIHKNIVIEQNIHLNDSTWLPDIIDAQFIDVDNSGNKQFIFTVFTGYALYPRGIYKYDFKTNTLTANKLPAAVSTFNHADFDNDGSKEIILSAFACDNYGIDTLKYSDNYSWLFFLDEKLKWFRQPHRYYPYPSRFTTTMIYIDGNPIILSVSSFLGDKSSNKPTTMMLLDREGKTLKQKEYGNIQTLNVIHYDANLNPVITIFEDKKRIIQLDKDFNIIREREFKNDFILLNTADLFKDGNKEYICQLNDEVLILSNELDVLSRIPFSNVSSHIYIREIRDAYNQLLIKSLTEKAILVQFKDNPFYFLLTSLYILLPGIIYLFLALNYNLFSFLLIYSGFMILHLNKSRNGILIFSYNRNIYKSNSNFYRLLGLQKQPKDKDLFKTIPETNALGRKLQSIISDSESEDKHLFSDLYPNIKITVEKIKSIFNKPIAYVVEAEDISEPIKSDRSKVWSRTVQKMAHDIKTPLSSVTLGLKTLEYQLEKEDLKNKEDIFNEMLVMRSEIERVREMTKNFLKFTNMEKPNFENADLHGVIKRSINRFQDYLTNFVELNTDFDPEIEPFPIDAQQLELVINIIIENAIDAMKGSGILSIHTTIIENVIQEFGHQVEIQFTDNGPGIAKELQSRIFEPYFTDKDDGTGMGLAIAKKIIDDHKGRISVYSEGGLGATFTIILPYTQEP